MLLSLFSFVVLAGLVAAGNGSHAPRSDSISCTPVPGATGVLQISPVNGANPPPSSYVGLQMINELQQAAGDPGQQFSFENCTSTYMNLTTIYAGLATIYYGHVTLVDNPSLCLTSNIGDSEALIVPIQCDMNDDSFQQYQFWELTVIDGNTYSTLNLVGHPAAYPQVGWYNASGTGYVRVNNQGTGANYDLNLIMS